MYEENKSKILDRDSIHKAFGFKSLSFDVLPSKLKSIGIGVFNGDVLGNKTPFTDNKYFIVGKKYYLYELFDTEYAIDEVGVARTVRKLNWNKISV